MREWGKIFDGYNISHCMSPPHSTQPSWDNVFSPLPRDGGLEGENLSPLSLPPHRCSFPIAMWWSIGRRGSFPIVSPTLMRKWENSSPSKPPSWGNEKSHYLIMVGLGSPLSSPTSWGNEERSMSFPHYLMRVGWGWGFPTISPHSNLMKQWGKLNAFSPLFCEGGMDGDNGENS